MHPAALVSIVLLAHAASGTHHFMDPDEMLKQKPSQFNGNTFTYISITDPTALNLDGSQYGISVCLSTSTPPSTVWQIVMQGGGWCYDEQDCLERASTRLGSNKTWAQEATGVGCNPATTINQVNMFYGDGASHSGFRQEAWPVPGKPGAKLYFRGARTIDATLDKLLTLGLDAATHIVLSGGSAGGLSTFLHLDHVRARMEREAPHAHTGLGAAVVGMPVCGFFLDHGNDGFAPPNVTYTLQMQYVYDMQNASGSLSPACRAHYGAEAWKCILAPHAAPFIETPWFAKQSRFDKWQLAEELFLPCIGSQPYGPPYHPTTCDAKQRAAIAEYGPQFMAQFRPLIDAKASKNGAFLDACIIHGSTNSSIDGKSSADAFNEWLGGGKQWWLMLCDGSDEAGPCDPSPECAPF